MSLLSRWVITGLCWICGFGLTYAQQADGLSGTIPLKDMSFFKEPGENWHIVGEAIASLEKPNEINTMEGTGILVNNPRNHQGQDLLTNFKHGDIDLELDFMMAKDSNSGIYLQGRYEIQLLDSWTVKVPTSADNGGIYERWDANQPPGKRGYQGYPPRQNASRALGIWQHLEISFQAPRFNTNGKKIENAKILIAKLNGVTIHERLELQGPTRGALGDNEVAHGPLRLQGDHGAVAFRDIKITLYDQPVPRVENLEYRVFEDASVKISELDKRKTVKSGQSEQSQTQKLSKQMKAEKGTFGYDVQFLEKYTDVVILKSDDKLGSILVTPEMQGRVMTSSLEGDGGRSLGWINHELIASGEIKEHITPYGGEDRFWLGPEGGQYSVFFEAGKEMVFENWHVPSGFNTDPWNLVAESDSSVTVEKGLSLTNYNNINFDLNVTRTIKVIEHIQTEHLLNTQIPTGIKQVAFESENTIENIGDKAWTKETGAPSIWILGMLKPAPGVTIVIPYKEGSEEKLGPVVTTDYFGEISSKRLKVEDGIIYFKADGTMRGKLGVSPQRALSVAGSYDETNNILTIIHYTIPKNSADYVNHLWKQQDKPYKGNVVFAYNDGPLEDGSQLGPFYELESSSPAAFLEPDEKLTHRHQVFHFTGDTQTLSGISEEVLGVGLSEITAAF